MEKSATPSISIIPPASAAAAGEGVEQEPVAIVLTLRVLVSRIFYGVVVKLMFLRSLPFSAGGINSLKDSNGTNSITNMSPASLLHYRRHGTTGTGGDAIFPIPAAAHDICLLGRLLMR